MSKIILITKFIHQPGKVVINQHYPSRGRKRGSTRVAITAISFVMLEDLLPTEILVESQAFSGERDEMLPGKLRCRTFVPVPRQERSTLISLQHDLPLFFASAEYISIEPTWVSYDITGEEPPCHPMPISAQAKRKLSARTAERRFAKTTMVYSKPRARTTTHGRQDSC